ncbi:DNA polymerase III subunit chi [Actibacterium sp. 188UL27-1]|uniref:DNA polymerase III subunit chi n=1 Tax=Actibacterium sp. 188UL27-1 TaxID=2786961 RepID=UPI00195D0E2D|nr:DNA polymerase III subunit chi [Actibacterium sp. 188UL27-1]MBM7067490.1 DNA polymerase III subunit chi [Actibacterium sp. 188UL27-1]
MGQALFYHLTRRPLEQTLPVLLERSLARGWNVLVRGAEQTRLDWLDEKLWLISDEGFLPHGIVGGPHDAAQPILLSIEAAPVNGAQCLMSIDGAEVTPEIAQPFERVCLLFDGHDEGAVNHARGQWTALTGAGIAAQYWSEDSGKWEMKAESGA